MTYNSGTSTDYLDLLDQLLQVATGRHLDAVVINAGGTGYEVGEILDISATGSTSTHVCQLEVTSIAAGVIDGIRIYRGGAYTVDPTTIVANVSTSTNLLFDGSAVATADGTGATFDLTFAATGWTQLSRSSDAASAVVGAAGNGYNIGDILTVVGGVQSIDTPAVATFTVATLTGGAGSGVATVTLTTAGDYQVIPSNAVLTTNDGTGDDLCTLTVTWADLAGDTVVVMQGDAGSAVDPIVGIHTWSELTDQTGANTVYNWSIHPMTAFAASTPLHAQTNVMDEGFDTVGDGTITTSTSGDGSWVPLKIADAFDMTWWMRIDGRSIVMIVKLETASTTYYAHMGFGLLDGFGTATELPYPAFCATSSDRPRAWYADTSSIWGGLSEVISRADGPAFMWEVDGAWTEVKNAGISGNNTTTPTYSEQNNTPRANVGPLGRQNVHEEPDDAIWGTASTNGFDATDLTPATGATRIYRTPDTGGDLFPMWPITYTRSDSATDKFFVQGEVPGVFWLDQADSGFSSEDRLTQAGERYTIFQNGTRIQPWSYLALKED